MVGRSKASSKQAASKQASSEQVSFEHGASNGIAPVHRGLGPERVVEIQRARILAAMVEVCAERGAGSISVAHVVERAGVSRRTFYELYRDREECFLGAFDEAIMRASRYVLDGYDPSAGWDVRIRTALVGLLSFLDVERGVGQFLIVGSLGAGTGALERRERVLARMINLIDEGGTLMGTPHRAQAGRETKAGTELPSLTAEGILGGVLSILHSRLLDPDGSSLLQLTGPLMSMIVLPYLGTAAAKRELARPAPPPLGRRAPAPADPLRDLHMRLTYRTVLVLMSVAALGGRGSHPSNREIGLAAGISDQGQISKLLTRLSGLGLIENSPAGLARGAPNAWTLTEKGVQIEQAIGERSAG
jgi:AcrR family transcriptional regulator